MKLLKYIPLCVILSFLTSCNDWFDVHPTSQILVGEQFDTEKGFSDQLTGVYTKMKGTSLYGRNLTYGFAEVLSQNYDIVAGSNFYEASQYNYENSSVKSMIQNIWLDTYNCIANLNILIEYIDKVDKSIFSENAYDRIKGQALGLRAFLHFELLRYFAPSYGAGGENTPAIPYVTTYSTSVTPLSTSKEVIEFAKKDLLDAKACFDNDRDIYEYYDVETYNYYTRQYFNAYAVLGTLARIHQWCGEYVSARDYALKVIDEHRISWVHYSTMTSQYEKEWDRTFSSEHLFRMSMTKFDEIVTNYFGSSAPDATKLNISDLKMDQIYEVSAKAYGTDYRYTCCFQYDGSDQYYFKYKQNVGGSYTNMIPVMKLGEMALIVSESYLAEGNTESAVEYLNLIRENRGSLIASDILSSELTASEVENEIYKEYRKDHLGEGQMFLFYKRKGYDQIPGSNASAANVYVFPLPDNEIEFGNR